MRTGTMGGSADHALGLSTESRDLPGMDGDLSGTDGCTEVAASGSGRSGRCATIATADGQASRLRWTTSTGSPRQISTRDWPARACHSGLVKTVRAGVDCTPCHGFRRSFTCVPSGTRMNPATLQVPLGPKVPGCESGVECVGSEASLRRRFPPGVDGRGDGGTPPSAIPAA